MHKKNRNNVQDSKANSKEIPKRVPPPRRKKNVKRAENNWCLAKNATFPIQTFPYLPYNYGYSYNCAFAIPLIPFPIGVNSAQTPHFFADDANLMKNHQVKELRNNIQLLRLPPKSTGYFPLNDSFVPDLKHNQDAVRRNGLFRNESLPSLCSMKEQNTMVSRPQSVNVLAKSEQNGVSVERLLDAFKKLEENVNHFKNFLSQNLSEETSNDTPLMITNEVSKYKSNLTVCSSSSELVSVRKNNKFNFSQRMEDLSNQSKKSSLELPILFNTRDELIWVLNQPPDVKTSSTILTSPYKDQFIERRDRVVKTLCIGKGFDQDDWLLFQQLVSHCLSIKEKLKLLNAEAICSENINAGVASLRNSLLSISKYGESVLNQRSQDYSGVSFINLDQGQKWAKIKGCLEILQLFGYDWQGPYQLCYIANSTVTDNVFVAELTLDILILAEEFRFYLDGLHPNPIFVTQLFNREFHFHSRNKRFEPDINHIEDTYIPPNSNSYTNEQKQSVAIQTVESCVDKYENILSPKSIDHNKDLNSDIGQIKPFITPVLPPKTKKIVAINNPDMMDKVDKHKRALLKTDATSTEDHIYEEISEVKADVQKLQQRQPPPLPKKLKLSDYTNNVKCKIFSTKSPKKRPAPMPPHFNNMLYKRCQDSGKPIDECNNFKLHSGVCDQCGKLSFKKIDISNHEKNEKEIGMCPISSNIKNLKHFIAQDYRVGLQNSSHISQDRFHLGKMCSRSMDSILQFNNKQSNHDIFSWSSMPVMMILSKYQTINPSIGVIDKDKSIEIFENNKNLALNINIVRTIPAKVHQNICKEYVGKQFNVQLSTTDVINENKSVEQKEFLNLDAIPFMDSTEDLSFCSEKTVPEQAEGIDIMQSPKFNEIKDTSDDHKASVESLEVKQILFRKSNSDSVLCRDEFPLNNTDNRYREPVIFNAQNSQIGNRDPQNEEDRYEIPDVPLHERHGLVPCLPLKKFQNKKKISGANEVPKRPCRKLKSPPLPPKPKEKLPPPLPPKGLPGTQNINATSSKNCVQNIKRSISSPHNICRPESSLPVLSKSFSSTGLVFVGNEFNAQLMIDVKPKKYWPKLFCSCLPKSQKITKA